MMMKKCSASVGASHGPKGQQIVKPTQKLALAVLIAANLALPALAQTPASITTLDKLQTRLGPLEFKDGAPRGAVRGRSDAAVRAAHELIESRGAP